MTGARGWFNTDISALYEFIRIINAIGSKLWDLTGLYNLLLNIYMHTSH